MSQYVCKECEYYTSRKNDWMKHITTAKHMSHTAHLFKSNSITYDCMLCNRTYKTKSGLWKHRQQCDMGNSNVNDVMMDENNTLVKYLMKENSEFKKIIVEQGNQLCDAIKNHNNTIINNVQNNHFNLQVYLNETCKDAMNLDEFIENIQLQNSDLDETARIGYVNGTSRIIINELNKICQSKRPIQCSDIKRETVYVKQNNVWNKDIKLLEKGIVHISNKQIKQLQHWKNQHPDCSKYDSKYNNLYLKMITEIMSCSENDNCNKIATNILPITAINKRQ